MPTLFCALLLVLAAAASGGESFRLAIMQATKGEAERYAPLVPYLRLKGVEASLVGMKSYQDAAAKFAAGEADAMFSGSGVAAGLILRDLAQPSVRPENAEGISTYWATIVARTGTSAVTDSKALDGKKVLTCALASSGEIYLRAMTRSAGVKPEILIAPSHGAALAGLDKGQADYAVVKNRVWDKEKAKYPGLVEVGKDVGENPDSVLMVSGRADQVIAAKVREALLALQVDGSAEGKAVRESLKLARFIPTAPEAFTHSLEILRQAGAGKDWAFSFAP